MTPIRPPGPSRRPPRTARLLTSQGRPGPAWPLDAATCRALLEIWRTIGSGHHRPTPGPPAGYRGVLIETFAGATWVVSGGLVTCRSVALTETRHDPDRRFERQVLASAPAGALPRHLAEPGGPRPGVSFSPD